MTLLTTRKKNALETKKRILETALDLFSKSGFDNVTVDEIVLESDTSKGAFYGHFNSKYEVFLEKFKEIDIFYENFQATLPSDLKSEQKIMRLAVTQMRFLKDDLGKDLLRTVYLSALSPKSPNYLASTERKLFAVIDSFVKEGQEKGEFVRDISRKDTTMIITRCMRGTLFDWFIFGNDFDLVLEIEKILVSVFEGIKHK